MRLTALSVLAALAVVGSPAARPVQVTFTGTESEHTWSLEELNTELPADWTPYEFLVIELKASSSQRVELGLDTAVGRLTKRIHPLPGVWVRAAIPLVFYRAPAGEGIDLAATFNQPRDAYWINLGGGDHGPTTDVRGLTLTMYDPVGAPTIEIRSVTLAATDPGDAVLEGNPLIDELGQYRYAEWAGKARSLEELQRAWAAEKVAPDPALGDRCEYGGFLETKARATGFFRLEEVDDRWWFVCPDGHLFYSAGLNGVGPFSGTRVEGREEMFAAHPPAHLAPDGGRGDRRFGSFHTWNLQRRYGDDWRSTWAHATTTRLTAWGFNSIHYWGPRDADPEAEPRVPYAQMLRGWQTEDSIMGMPDVYAEDFPRRVDQVAASQLAPRRDDPYMLGYFIGNEPPWPGREDQLVDAILDGPRTATRTRLEAHLAEGDTPERRKAFVLAAFERYLDTINAAVRKHAPNHLNLGIRFGGRPHDEVIALARDADVYSHNIYEDAPSRDRLDHLYDLVQRPILIGEFHIGVPNRGLAPGLVQAMNQEERARGYRYYVEQAAAHPAVIGTHWFQWLDQPATGRRDGENYNIGFIDVTDQPYAEMVAAAIETHGRVLAVHRGETPPVERRPRASEAGAPVGQ